MFKVKNENKQEDLRPIKQVHADILAPRLTFIISTLALVLFGLVMVFSASYAEAIQNNEWPVSYLLKQSLFCIVGIILAVIIWRKIPFGWWKTNIVWILFGILFLLMLATMFGGTDILGARRWIYLGPMSLQPSEFAKIALVLLVAKLYSEMYVGLISDKRFYLLCGLAVALMLGFVVVAQSDLGTTIICIIGIIAALWMARAPKFLVLILLAATVAAGIFFIVGSAYRSNRFAYLDPYNDGHNGYGSGYQIIRSFFAFGEGGIFGVGLGNSYEKYQYLPEAETDFIFAIIGEELGLIGCLFVITLFLIFLISGLRIAKRSNNCFGSSVSGAFVIMIVAQAFMNMFCVVGLIPITGKPLPFISSGGSSLIASLLMAGFVLSASEDDSKPDIYEKRRNTFKAFNMSSLFANLSRPNSNANQRSRVFSAFKRDDRATSRQSVSSRDRIKMNKINENNEREYKTNKKQMNTISSNNRQKSISGSRRDSSLRLTNRETLNKRSARTNNSVVKNSKSPNTKSANSKRLINFNTYKSKDRPSAASKNKTYNNSKSKTSSYIYKRKNSATKFKPNVSSFSPYTQSKIKNSISRNSSMKKS